MVAVGSAGGNQAKSASPRGPARPGGPTATPRWVRPLLRGGVHKRDAARRLTEHCRCIAYVLRGLGASGLRRATLGRRVLEFPACRTATADRETLVPQAKHGGRTRRRAAWVAGKPWLLSLAVRSPVIGPPTSTAYRCSARPQCLKGRAAQGVIHLPALLVGGVRLSARQMMFETELEPIVRGEAEGPIELRFRGYQDMTTTRAALPARTSSRVRGAAR